jgi:hypothetical protein
MGRDDVGYEKKYRYLLYRVQHALMEMHEFRVHAGRRHLENGLYSCEGYLDPREHLVSHEEMTALKKEIYAEELEV